MNLSDFTVNLVQKKVGKLMIWTGPECKMMDIFIDRISKMFGLDIARVDCVKDIMTKIQSKKMLETKGKLYIVRDDSDVWDSENFVGKMNSILDKDMLILIYTNMDKRKKFAKESDPVEFDYLSEDVLTGYVQRECEMSENNIRRLIQMCEQDYSRILLEVDKVKTYAQAESVSHDASFKELCRCNMIYAPVGDIIFQMTDSVVLRKKDEAYRLLYQLYRKGEAPIKILSILYTNYRNLLVIQGTDGGAGVSERTGLTPWQINLARDKKGIWSQGRIKSILKTLSECEKGIKTGKYDDVTAIEVAMTEILG